MKLIRLSERKLQGIITEAVSRILNERGGFASYDGNSMVGGRWEAWDKEATANIMDMVLDNICDDTDEVDDKWNEIMDVFNRHKSLFDITAKFEVGYDESTGMGSYNSPYVEFVEITRFNENALMKLVGSLPIGNAAKKSVADAIRQCIDEILDGMHNDMFNVDRDMDDRWFDYED